jgi:hypothetical protein
MGVMACDRNGCGQPMCTRASHRFGYICNYCFSELLQIRQSISLESIQEFMETPKDEPLLSKETYETLLNDVFPNID